MDPFILCSSHIIEYLQRPHFLDWCYYTIAIGALLCAVLTLSIFGNVQELFIVGLYSIVRNNNVLFSDLRWCRFRYRDRIFTHIARTASGDVPPKLVVPQIASDS
jgi:hypothetical protein